MTGRAQTRRGRGAVVAGCQSLDSWSSDRGAAIDGAVQPSPRPQRQEPIGSRACDQRGDPAW